jgi:steroid delta-isomerase-like uncharacterized protein
MSIAAQLVRRFYHVVWNHADEAVARELLHPDFNFRGSLGPELKGPEAFIGYMRSIHAALGGYECTIVDLLVEGSRAAARMTFSGTHRAVLFGVPATGQRITWSAAAFFETDGRYITRLWVLGDVDGVKQQLGASPSRVF